MPTFRTGDMWSEWGKPDTLFCITTNAIINSHGELVMGRGIAAQARDRIPGVAKASAAMINVQPRTERYGLLVLSIHGGRLGLFQVKDRWDEPAKPDLIRLAVAKLVEWAKAHTGHTVHLNFPGIGNGGLSESEVRPLLDPLPENVNVWQRGSVPV